MSIECWGDEGVGGSCAASIPDGELETMARNGWGWIEAPDPGSPTGLGMYFACPDHKNEAFGQPST